MCPLAGGRGWQVLAASSALSVARVVRRRREAAVVPEDAAWPPVRLLHVLPELLWIGPGCRLMRAGRHRGPSSHVPGPRSPRAERPYGKQAKHAAKRCRVRRDSAAPAATKPQTPERHRRPPAAEAAFPEGLSAWMRGSSQLLREKHWIPSSDSGPRCCLRGPRCPAPVAEGMTDLVEWQAAARQREPAQRRSGLL